MGSSGRGRESILRRKQAITSILLSYWKFGHVYGWAWPTTEFEGPRPHWAWLLAAQEQEKAIPTQPCLSYSHVTHHCLASVATTKHPQQLLMELPPLQPLIPWIWPGAWYKFDTPDVKGLILLVCTTYYIL